MAVISGLNVYPVKSCKGIALEQAELTESGLAFDRHWMLVDNNKHFVTQRDQPRMALVASEIRGDSLMLSAPGMPALAIAIDAEGARLAVTVWDDRCSAIDQGQVAADWFSSFLQRPLRLVRFDPAIKRYSSAEYTGDTKAATEFSDGYAILLLSEASLADLNARLEQPLAMNRFRPNIVIRGVQAYDEDHLYSLRRGDLELRIVKPCTRCQITTTNQDSGEVGREPLQTLRTYRRHPKLGAITFGQNAILIRGAGEILRLGDQFEETWNF
jgi:uncharacterized protein